MQKGEENNHFARQNAKKKPKNLRISQIISNFAPQIGQERPKY